MNKMLDIDNWYTIVDKLCHQLYKPPDYIMSDEEYFMKYAYVIREHIKGIIILNEFSIFAAIFKSRKLASDFGYTPGRCLFFAIFAFFFTRKNKNTDGCPLS